MMLNQAEILVLLLVLLVLVSVSCAAAVGLYRQIPKPPPYKRKESPVFDQDN
jgi:hypothetical protein